MYVIQNAQGQYLKLSSETWVDDYRQATGVTSLLVAQQWAIKYGGKVVDPEG